MTHVWHRTPGNALFIASEKGCSTTVLCLTRA